MAAAREPDGSGAIALLRLFGAYDEIKSIQSRFEKVRTKVNALGAMAEDKDSYYIKLIKKGERNQAEESAPKHVQKLHGFTDNLIWTCLKQNVKPMKSYIFFGHNCTP